MSDIAHIGYPKNITAKTALSRSPLRFFVNRVQICHLINGKN